MDVWSDEPTSLQPVSCGRRLRWYDRVADRREDNCQNPNDEGIGRFDDRARGGGEETRVDP
jgi:hypothetical protein